MAKSEEKLTALARPPQLIAALDKLHRATRSGRDLHGEFSLVIVGEAVESQARLLQMADALYSQGPRSRLAKGRQKQRGQNPDDRNHTEQFDQAERAAELEPAQIATSSKGISVWSA